MSAVSSSSSLAAPPSAGSLPREGADGRSALPAAPGEANTSSTPDYSSAMLRLFLRARIVARRQAHGETPAQAKKAVSAVIRRDARITHRQFAAALAGRLMAADVRARIWGALGHVPAERGIVLTDDGGQAASARDAEGVAQDEAQTSEDSAPAPGSWSGAGSHLPAAHGALPREGADGRSASPAAPEPTEDATCT